MTTIDDDAREYGEHIKHGGWRLALLVARNVEKGRGASSGSVPNDRYGHDGKVSASHFAELSGTSAPRVLRHLTAWEKAADAGHVTHAAELVPGQEVALPTAELWASIYDAAAAGSRPRDSKPINAVQIMQKRGIDAVVAAMPEELQSELYVLLGKLIDERYPRVPLRDSDVRAAANLLLVAVMKGDRTLRNAVDLLRSGDVERLDDDDQMRVHTFVERMRRALDLIDMAAGGGVDDAALEAWLSEDAS